MIDIIHSIILGAVQGLTEFLPISSSGHLVLIPAIFGWQYQGVSFDVALHAGTALALIIFFWRDWVNIIKLAVSSKRSAVSGNYPSNILWQILVATIPAGILGLLIDKYMENNIHSLLFIAFNFAFFGFLLWFVDRRAKNDLEPGKLTYKKSFLIGLSQSVALIPGVSRSGITLTASRWLGLSREDAARFSFILSTPVIIGAFLVKLPSMAGEDMHLSFWLGILTATIFGLLAIKFLLNYLKKSDFSVFLWYRLAVAAFVILWLALK